MKGVREIIAEAHPDILFMDGYDDCVLGVVRRFGLSPMVAYDEGKVIQKLIHDGMTEDEAYEWFEVNQIGAWMGETTPCFLTWATQYMDGYLPAMDETKEG